MPNLNHARLLLRRPPLTWKPGVFPWLEDPNLVAVSASLLNEVAPFHDSTDLDRGKVSR